MGQAKNLTLSWLRLQNSMQGLNFISLLEGPGPQDGKKVGQIWSEIRFQQDLDGTLSTFYPLSPIDLEKLDPHIGMTL